MTNYVCISVKTDYIHGRFRYTVLRNPMSKKELCRKELSYFGKLMKF